MKIKCKPRLSDREWQIRDQGRHYLWTVTQPFNMNPRGILIHRVRIGFTFFRNGKRSHDAVTYWCSNSAVGVGVNLIDAPPADRLLCAHCERIAVEAGEPTAEALVGRHVHIGEMKAFRLCCRGEQN